MTGPSDVRGFYAALGIHLPDWAQRNTTVRCFANPEAHAHDDRRPSCSVSLEHGAWRCWTCGAHGGAYDAALAHGHTPASAFELLVTHGLAEHEPLATSRGRRPPRSPQRTPGPRTARSPLAATDADVAVWHEALLSDHGRRWRELLSHQRLWSTAVMRELELGCDDSRITIPIRTATGQLRGVLRYRPNAAGHKMLAVPGSRLGLIPHPVGEPARHILLVEGPPDMIAARSRGWPAIAVPGDHAWQAHWASLLAGRLVTIVTDSDPPGRDAAQRISADLRPLATVRVVDLAAERDDGYDLTNWLLDQPPSRRKPCAASSSPRSTITR